MVLGQALSRYYTVFASWGNEATAVTARAKPSTVRDREI